MAAWLLRRRLSRTATRLIALRAELAQIDEQAAYLDADADDTALRAMVSETPEAAHEANESRKHAAAMARHRRHVIEQIAELERRQDDLLDELTRS